MDKEKKPIIIETADIYLHFPYIMEEEADDLADFLEEEHIEYEGATDIFIDLQNQVKKQKEVIDKIQMIVTDMQLELMKLQPYHSYVIDGNIVRNFTKDFEDILKEVSDE
jgi:hypothetical protein